jgi:MOSC domain-containing protein YiiM
MSAVVTTDQLLAGLDDIRAAPAHEGMLELVVRRPAPGDREVLEEGELDPELGLVGDSWSERGSRPNPKSQVTVMSARAATLIAGDPEHWPPAGDQLYVDLDLGAANTPPGTLLAVGSAVLEITDQPHLGCGKFSERFGEEAREFVNTPEGVALNLRGLNARVVTGGTIRRGDLVRKLA